jgi:hypothetical protein
MTWSLVALAFLALGFSLGTLFGAAWGYSRAWGDGYDARRQERVGGRAALVSAVGRRARD